MISPEPAAGPFAPADLVPLRDAVRLRLTARRCGADVARLSEPVAVAHGDGRLAAVGASPHIHAKGSLLVDEVLDCTARRTDASVAQRLQDAVGWGCQTDSTVDRELDHGTVGRMSERFCYSEGLLTERHGDGSPASTWFCRMPWASACAIRGMVGDRWPTVADAQDAA